MALPKRVYDRTIVVQREGTPTDDGYTTVPGAWADLVTTPARQRTALGSERLASAENAATAPIIFYVPWSSVTASVTPKDRVSYGGRMWDVKSCIEVGRHREMEIAAVARADA